MANPITKQDYDRLKEIAYELKQIREKYCLKELEINNKKWFNNEYLNISIRVEEPRDFYTSNLMFMNEIDEERATYKKFIKKV